MHTIKPECGFFSVRFLILSREPTRYHLARMLTFVNLSKPTITMPILQRFYNSKNGEKKVIVSTLNNADFLFLAGNFI